jgi:hypothetical protein
MIKSIKNTWNKICKSFDLEQRPLILKKQFIVKKKKNKKK